MANKISSRCLIAPTKQASTDTGLKVIQPLTLRRNFSWTLIGNMVGAGCKWGILVVLAKMGTPEMVGQFALGYAIGAPVIMFTGLNLRSVQATDAKGEYLFSQYIRLRLMTSILALGIIIAITLFLTLSRETKMVIMAIGAAKVIESWQDIIYGLLQKHERMDRIAISIIYTATLELGALILILLLTGQLFPAILMLTVVRILVLATYDWKSVNLFSDIEMASILQHPRNHSLLLGTQSHWNMTRFKRLTLLTLPLGIVVTLNSLNVNIPRLFIGKEMGEYYLGIFAALAYVMIGGNMVVMALALSLSPRLSKYYVAIQKSDFRRILFKGLLIVSFFGLSGVFITYIAGQEILSILYGPEYSKHVEIFIWLMIGALFAYLGNFLRQSMTAARLIRVQMPIYLSSNLILIIACYYLVPLYGLKGAAWADIISSFIIFVGNGFTIFYFLKSKKNYGYAYI